MCGRDGPADRETGYNADDLCPSCQALGWTEVDGEYVCDDPTQPAWSDYAPLLPFGNEQDDDCPF